MVNEDDVRRISLSLPGAYEHASYGGSPSWRTKPRMFTWIRDEDGALVIWVASVEEKGALVASDPNKFFTTPHYDGHPVVLVRMAAINVGWQHCPTKPSHDLLLPAIQSPIVRRSEEVRPVGTTGDPARPPTISIVRRVGRTHGSR